MLNQHNLHSSIVILIVFPYSHLILRFMYLHSSIVILIVKILSIIWYEVNIVDTILLIKVDNYEDFLKYSVGDKYPSLFCILSLLYQPSMNSNIASFVSS